MTSFQKFIVTAYRYMAAALLLIVLSTGVGYAVLTLFYVFSSSWAAPVVISRTHERILQMQAELFRTQQSIDTLDATVDGLNAESKVLVAQETSLTRLSEQARSAQIQQRAEDLQLAGKLAPLKAAKSADVARTTKILETLKAQEAMLVGELKTGLITKDDANRSIAALNTLRVSATDSAAANVALDHQIGSLRRSADTFAGGSAVSSVALDLLTRTQMLEAQVSTVQLKLAQNRAEAANKTRASGELKKMMATAEESPYYQVTQSGTALSFAFVPYANDDAAYAGAKVYDCTLQVLWCHAVGVIKHVYHDEERAQHPLFRLDMRGALVELTLDTPEAAHSRVVFLDSAPFGF